MPGQSGHCENHTNWRTTMKLMTKEIAKKLIYNDLRDTACGATGDEIVVKYFNPVGAATWFIVSGTPLNEDGEADYETDSPADWHLFGFCDLGWAGCEELGYVLLSELENVKLPWGMGIERDLAFKGSLAEVQASYNSRAA